MNPEQVAEFLRRARMLDNKQREIKMMKNATEILISQIFEKKEDTMICLAVADHDVKVGDIFTTRYQVSREDIVNDVVPRRNINVKSISIRVVKIIIDRKGTEVAQLDTSIEDGAIFHLQGDIDDLYLMCRLRAGSLPQN
ncbi:hypothetical protein [Ottowia oryzae]|uniref:hypothetical protein n=1 Tax=Ottowia oryzae TaxID=2109914 RepID=UPI000F505F95|nr:hypothetical protein [Ottowia oryzae]